MLLSSPKTNVGVISHQQRWHGVFLFRTFHEEHKSWLDDLKLRLSYGTAGNNNIPTGQLVQMYNNSATTWVKIENYWAPSKTYG